MKEKERYRKKGNETGETRKQMKLEKRETNIGKKVKKEGEGKEFTREGRVHGYDDDDDDDKI